MHPGERSNSAWELRFGPLPAARSSYPSAFSLAASAISLSWRFLGSSS